MPESAFIVRVPEAERHVAELRARHDPAAQAGVPAHVTILLPFMPPSLIGDAVLQRVSAIIGAVDAFSFTLVGTARFPDTLYLAPRPVEPFVALTSALAAAFPEYPPYGGAHATIVPHLTVAHADDARLASLESELRSLLPPDGVAARCEEVVLIENASGRWQPTHVFALRGAGPRRG